MTDVAVSRGSSVRGRSDIWAPAARGAVIPVAFVLGWFALERSGLSSSHLLVPIERILALPFSNSAGRELWPALGASVVRLVTGFVIGAGLGIALGVAMGLWRVADRAIAPSFNTLRQIALFAWIPLLTAWFGNGDGSKLVYIAMSAFFPAALNTYLGLRNIPEAFLEVARVLRLSFRTRLMRLVLPAALPSIFVGVQIALITAWLGTVSAEYAMGMGRGLGTFVSEGRGQFRMDVVLLGVIALALVGYTINVICTAVFRRLLVWKGGAA